MHLYKSLIINCDFANISQGLNPVSSMQIIEDTTAEQIVETGHSEDQGLAGRLVLPMIIEEYEDPAAMEKGTRMCFGPKCYWCHRERLVEPQVRDSS